MDGSKIKASAADDQSYLKSQLKEEQKKLRQEIQSYLKGGIEDDRKEDRLYGDAEGPETALESSRKLLEEAARRQREKARQKFEQEERERIEKKLSKQSKQDSKKAKEDENHEKSKKPSRLQTTNHKEMKQPPQEPAEAHVSEQADEPSGQDEIEEGSPSSEEEDIIMKKAIRLQKIDRALAACEDEPDDTKINLTDPDARFMKNRGRLTNSYKGAFYHNPLSQSFRVEGALRTPVKLCAL